MNDILIGLKTSLRVDDDRGQSSKRVRGRRLLRYRLYSDEIEKVLGKKPYPGTINVKVREEDYWSVRKRARNLLKGRVKDGIRLHDAYYVECLMKGLKGIIVFPTKGGHRGTLEVILPEKIQVREGEKVRIYVRDVTTPFPSLSNT